MRAFSFLRLHGPAAVFIWGVLKSVLPLPTPSLMVAAGAMIDPPGKNSFRAVLVLMRAVALPGAAGNTVGGQLLFWAAYWGGRPVLERYARAVGTNHAALHRLESRLSENAGAVIFASRALPIIPLSAGSLLAGFMRISPWTFTVWTFLGALVRCLLLGMLGYAIRGTYAAMQHGLTVGTFWFAIGAVEMIGLGLLLVRRRHRRDGVW